jgi:hypothetical protein
MLIIQQLDLSTNTIDIELVDATGRVIKTTQILQGTTFTAFDVSTLYSGTYYVRIKNNGAVTTHSVIIAE